MVIVVSWPIIAVIGWIASGWALVGLIGFEASWPAASRARRRILRTLTVGDVALVAAVVLAATRSDGFLAGGAAAREALMTASTGGAPTLHVVMVLVVVAGASRSALFPFHRWLIGTLAAPTPVSALVHAGLVSGAGLLLLRLRDPFVSSTPAVILAFTLAVLTVVLASAAGALRSDVKGSLAWSTVAQMAFMIVQCSVGAFSSAVFHIAGHGMYKASLFLDAGDTAAKAMRDRRSPSPLARIRTPLRWTLSIAFTTIAVTAAAFVIPPDVSPAGTILVLVFAWLTIVFGTDKWLQRSPFPKMATAGTGAMGAIASAFLYLGGLRLAEAFVKPSLAGLEAETAIGPTVLVATLVSIAALVGTAAAFPGAAGVALRDRAQRVVLALAEAGRARRAAPGTEASREVFARPVESSGVRRAEIRADVAVAAAIIAPQWPLSSFVAVNPLGDLESMGFDAATAAAREWLGARTHLDLEHFRRGHSQGLTTDDDLRHVAFRRFTELCSRDPIVVDGRRLEPVEVIVADMLHGPPDHATVASPADDTTRLINAVLSAWLAAYVEPPHWEIRHPGETFTQMARRLLLLTDPRLRASADARDWISRLGEDPASILDAVFTVTGITEGQRVAEARRHLCELPGWSGLAKWRNQWAQPDEPRPPLAPIEIVAIRALIELAIGAPIPARPTTRPVRHSPTTPSLDERVKAVLGSVAPTGGPGDRIPVAKVLSQVPPDTRGVMWVEAQERAFDDRLLAMLDRLDPGPVFQRPEVQMVFCIDVRSEGLRRNLEDLHDTETLGFAGFFGVPMRIRRVGWEHSEPRCPVLVSPVIQAAESPRQDAIPAVAQQLSIERRIAGVKAAHSGAKYGPGAPFALAETAGWLVGPAAAARTFVPRRPRPLDPPGTRMLIDDDELLVDRRIFFAESVLNTMGLTERFSPLVVLCGHTSETTNNPHATALMCGACAGAGGEDNARAVAALLNSADVRHGLIDRGITIPDDTWFLAAVHDTASDRVALLDATDAPPTHRAALIDLQQSLDRAGQRQAAARSTHLPGDAERVSERGADWAQVRPEWGLARNAAFIIGPRSMTTGLDLDGRAFLHTYNAADDPTGRVLETIMTAPLVVGHWISAQYYFSTVDPEVFGAGNKLLHNPIGTTAVFSGDGGDIRIGLPLQSTHVDGAPFHQPLRLLAVIQADLGRIEEIISNNRILRTLVEGSWIRIAARARPDHRWSTRTPAGTWTEMPRVFDPDPTLKPTTEAP